MGQVCPAVAGRGEGASTVTPPQPILSNANSVKTPPVEKKVDEKLLDNYSLGKVIGQGAFGVVYSCRHKSTNEEFAVKMIDQVETPLAEIRVEVEMLKLLAHPTVAKLHDVFYEKVFVCMVMEIYHGGDMIEGMQLHWKSKGMIPMPVIQNMSKMMFAGMDWLHSSGVVHRDLKGDNYLQDVKELENPKCRVYLSDFATVLKVSPTDRLRQKCGTKTYWAPEFYSLNYNQAVDIWALGVVIFGMVTGRFPFKGEDDVRNKQPRYPSRVSKDGENFLRGLLEREEAKRLTAKQGLEHPFLANYKSAADTQEPLASDFKPEVKELGPNAGIAERRKELVERLEEAAAVKGKLHRQIINNVEQLFPSFEVMRDKRAEKKTQFEWWTPQQVAEAKFADKEKSRDLKEEGRAEGGRSSETRLTVTLENHNIRTSNFGLGKAKTFTEFATELSSGQARLMLDATKHRCVVRVVDLVLLRLVVDDGGVKRFCVKIGEKYPDGRMRDGFWQLPGAKKMPHENGLETARRIIKDRLHMADCTLPIDFKTKECFEDDEDSPSYPGVRTVYRKEIFEVIVKVTETSIMERLGLNEHYRFKVEDTKGYTYFHQWMTDIDCVPKKVRLRAPTEGLDVSALVFPPIGLDKEELEQFLTESKVDVSQFGKDGVKTLQEFSEELVKGESALVRREDQSLIRVVDALILKVANKDGSVIVETGQEVGGVKKDCKPRLPAVKRRSDENMFLAAHRVMSKVLRMSENLISIDPDSVVVIEEESKSASFGDLPTLYRRRIVNATLIEP